MDKTRRTVTAFTTHFTDFGLGSAPDVLTYLPNLAGFQTDLYTGAASYQYALDVPPGRGGLAPRLALSYSSASVDMLNEKAQVSFVGAGWGFSSSYIARDTRDTYDASDDVFTLVLDGASNDLALGVDGYYHTANEQYWRVIYDRANDRWLAITNDGTQYQYGYSANSRAIHARKNSTGEFKRETYAWHLEKAVDTHTNEIAYTYLHETATDVCGQALAHDNAIYPQLIRYNNNLTQIGLTYSARTDYNLEYPNLQCGPAPYQTKKLETVEISTTVSTLQLVRRYNLAYDYSTFPGIGHSTNISGHLTLKQITQVGDDGVSTLPAQTFAYSGNRLQQANNGIGGSVAFQYDTASAGNAPYRIANNYTGCIGAWCDFGWTGNTGTTVAGINYYQMGLMGIQSAGSYAYWNPGSFVPGATYSFLVNVLGVQSGTSVQVRAWDGTNEIALGNWAYPALDQQMQVGGTFTISDAANTLQLRIYTQSVIGVIDSTLQLFSTHHRVTSKTINDGQGNASTYTYAYQGAAVNDAAHSYTAQTANPRHTLGAEFRGHSQVTTTDPTGAKTETYFYQDDIYAGRAWKVNQLDANNVKFKSVINTFANRCVPVVTWSGTQYVNSCTSAATSAPPSTPTPTPPAPGPGTYDDTDARIAYSGAWTTYGQWHVSQAVGSSGTFTFYGTGIRVLYGADPSQGVMNFAVDGAGAGSVNQTSGSEWTFGGFLWQTTHTLAFTHASGIVTNIDAIVVLPPASTPPPAVTGNQAYFVYVSRTNVETYDGQATPKTTRTDFAYDDYGNVNNVSEYGDGASVYRRTEHTYYPNTTAWIVNQLALERILESGVTVISRTRNFYDGSADYTTPPVKGDLTKVDVWQDSATSFTATTNTYDAYGNRITTQDALHPPTSIEYDSTYRIFPVVITNTLGFRTTMTYDYRRAKLAAVTDPNNATTSYTYDVFGRTLSIKAPLEQSSANATVLYDYTLANPRSMVRVQVRNDLGGTNPATYQSAWWFYDGLGRTIQQQTQSATSGQIILTNRDYTARGQVWRASNPYTVTASGGAYQTPNWSVPFTTRRYDAIGRTLTITNTDSTTQNFAYNQWVTTFTDANTHQRQTIADAYGRINQVKEFNLGSAYTTNYAYDRLNRLTQVTDHAGNVTTMGYDWLGRKTAMSDLDMGAWSYAYDNAGNLKRQTDAKNQTTCFYYDNGNRLKGKNYRSDVNCPTTDPGSYTATYTYDAGTNQKGRRTGMSDASGSTSWTYDVQGRVLSRTDTITGAPAYTTQWTYDAMSRVRTMTYPDGEQVATTYNAQGLPATLGTYITASSYNAASQLTALTFGNNVVTTNYTYNSQNLRLTNLQTLAGATYLQRLNYTYDNVGNVSQIQDNVRNETQNFAYDDLDRLTSVTGAYSQGWTYNAIGNILTRTGVDAATFTYGDTNHKHAVTQVGTTAYTYDPNGSMTARGSDALLYDQENRLYRVTVGGTQTDYTYNADNARVKKVVGSTATYYVGNWYEVTNSAATKYYYFGAQRVAMRTSAGVTYLHGDHLGSTSVACNGTTGALVSRQTYYAFGGLRSYDVAQITTVTDYTFTGQKNDAASALMFYNARYYDANIGRFVQADPIVAAPFNPQSLNRFAYVLNNPVRYTDPTGYKTEIPDGYGISKLPPPPPPPWEEEEETSGSGGASGYGYSGNPIRPQGIDQCITCHGKHPSGGWTSSNPTPDEPPKTQPTLIDDVAGAAIKDWWQGERDWLESPVQTQTPPSEPFSPPAINERPSIPGLVITGVVMTGAIIATEVVLFQATVALAPVAASGNPIAIGAELVLGGAELFLMNVEVAYWVYVARVIGEPPGVRVEFNLNPLELWGLNK